MIIIIIITIKVPTNDIETIAQMHTNVNHNAKVLDFQNIEPLFFFVKKINLIIIISDRPNPQTPQIPESEDGQKSPS
jgi:hypothetical protein